MNYQYIIAGVVLLGGITVAAINLWIKRRKKKQNLSDSSLNSSSK
jgi:hypothetical protein